MIRYERNERVILSAIEGCLILIGLTTGCVFLPRPLPPADKVRSSRADVQPKQQQGDVSLTKDALSYGLVTSRVKKGSTTQAELLALFGGPNVATTDADGTETWVYERTVSESETVSGQSRSSDALLRARNLDVFFGLGYVGTGTANLDTSDQSSRRSKTSSSIKSLTVIVKFNKDKTVKDYSARAAQF